MIIACWSGPRNLSTAMMYAFGNRPDFEVVDEPFYAAYLAATGLEHPMRDEVLQAYETDADRVARACETAPATRPHIYQKHMTHHLVDGFSRDWFDAAFHLFLIRHPARVLASYAKKREAPTLRDIGFVQQAAIFDEVVARNLPHAVIDSFEIRADPERAMRGLCGTLNIPFDAAMLRWPEGGHQADGVWASHWYDAVHRSTGFAGAEGPLPDLPAALEAVAQAALPYYAKLHGRA